MIFLNFESIGRQVKIFRKRKKITQAELAERIEKSESYMSYIENAKRHVSLETLARISNELGTTLDEMICGNQIRNKMEYQTEMWDLLSDCSCYEKRIILELAVAMKASIRNNRSMIDNNQKHP